MKIPFNKFCKRCLKQFETIPEDARLDGEGVFKGYYWECCNSTMFVPIDKVKEDL